MVAPSAHNPLSPALFTGQHVLITGGSGAFGQAFVERVLADDPARCIVFSRDEAKQAAMRSRFPETGAMRYFVGDVTDQRRLIRALDGVDVVVHAAAMKRVPECEKAADLCYKVNVQGSINIADAACFNHVKKVLLLSTDKAAAPNTAYGASKLMAERAFIGQANEWGAKHGTRFACTRYGNVQASTGSVVPIWLAQRAKGQPFTLTDERMTRFWMGMPEAVDLVAYALTHMQGGEVFIPKLPAIRIRDLALALDREHGISVTGIRGHEKLHEALLTEDEARQTYDRGYCYVIEPPERPWDSNARAPEGKPISEGFAYRSDTARRLDVGELQDMLEAA